MFCEAIPKTITALLGNLEKRVTYPNQLLEVIRFCENLPGIKVAYHILQLVKYQLIFLRYIIQSRRKSFQKPQRPHTSRSREHGNAMRASDADDQQPGNK